MQDSLGGRREGKLHIGDLAAVDGLALGVEVRRLKLDRIPVDGGVGDDRACADALLYRDDDLAPVKIPVGPIGGITDRGVAVEAVPGDKADVAEHVLAIGIIIVA